MILGLALPFSVVPLVMFTADRNKMGDLVAPRWVTGLAVLTAVFVIRWRASAATFMPIDESPGDDV